MDNLKRKRAPSSLLADDAFEELDQEPAATEAPAAPVTTAVEVLHGATRVSVPLAGMTVAEARALMEGALHLDPEARVLVDGSEAGDTRRLEAGQRLEFIKRTGAKGRR